MRRRGWTRVAVATALTVAVVAPASAASAHEERPVHEFPAGTGHVPTYRPYDAAATHPWVVCKPASANLISAMPAGALKDENEHLLTECAFHSIQDAIDNMKSAAGASGSNIYVLPGVYDESDAYWRTQPQSDHCAHLSSAADGAYIGTIQNPVSPPAMAGNSPVALSYQDQYDCPHNLNMIAILGDNPHLADTNGIACDPSTHMCDLQIEGTGLAPADVLIDDKFTKLNAIRADRADGVFFRNFMVQQSEFNSLYVMESDGFAVDRVIARANDEYGFLAFATDHGLFSNCEAYYNGDSGIYPGGQDDLHQNDSPQRNAEDLPTPSMSTSTWAVEVSHCRSHDNTLGFSGTAGNSVFVHDTDFYNNATGISVDSFFPNHPGLPQDHSRFTNNNIYANNSNYYTQYVDKNVCDRPIKDRGYLQGAVCPSVPVPVGTGVIIAGGNYNSVDHDFIYDNWRQGTMLLWVPAALRNEFDPTKQFDTSNGNHQRFNTMGLSRNGQVLPNGLDFWWDDEGSGNCWDSNVSSHGAPTSNALGGLPTCASPSVFSPGTIAVKDAGFADCTQYNKNDPILRHPPKCSWFDSPTKPSGDGGGGTSTTAGGSGGASGQSSGQNAAGQGATRADATSGALATTGMGAGLAALGAVMIFAAVWLRRSSSRPSA
ncbi:MAG: right-handed parallel beta-helix repeat-containing protein [Actinomycetota bacterium]|nr:right-handed parallel beta-helix repeat-containing protein [Actinomycetota bacterium]